MNLVREKQFGKTKGHICAYRKPQNKYTPREDAASPTISIEVFFVSIIIDVHKGVSIQTLTCMGPILMHKHLTTRSYLLNFRG